MNFRTNIQLQKERNQIDYNSKLLLIGSCFSENIYHKLNYFKFNAFSNPFGILFNPIAIEALISNAINQKEYTKKDVFQLNERWNCFDAHSNLSSIDKVELLSNLNNAITLTNHQLKKATHIIITLGTSWVYRFIETDTIVGNCHKVPQKKFLKELLSVEEINASLENMCALIKDFNPTINILFTVSPVRHLKDGFVENSVSKAHLLAAIHQLGDKRKQLYYFPSYEIMLDDLRDYRFYTSDMVHPNETAINYIWNQFQKIWIDEKASSIMKEVNTIQKGLGHKPFNPTSKQHQQFLVHLKQQITSLKNNYNITF
ncbi:GSCFA domain-containing protein [Lutibacter profundi]|uniref:GSCFA domain-containing protein n=1 Tax=Lutibacter profundi TaxID=1622118 RepID=A0A0X8G6I1_9FLAO|nr:GSCFA domain-containing protein [Lutibacter profundi]AMC10982.1 GSCFA domain-containing protein [Lutibacter profundi]